ncbi:MAG TPA: helix-turn-helix domain-containing protein [Thermoanaerobaculia bacterium]|nr:helix-turn-helix domain-containing protein [Thermoanaerobaculia bacterium]
MLGDIVREARNRKGLTQARLARLAGVSRRHLAALEKGANVSVLVLRKVAGVLELREIPLGDVSLRTQGDGSSLNVALLTDTLREARSGTRRVEAILTRAEGIASGETPEPRPLLADAPAPGSFTSHFPRLPVRTLELRRHRLSGSVSGNNVLRDDASGWLEVRTAGELRHGAPVDESKSEPIVLPAGLVEEGEIVFRVRGDDLRDHNIEDGDLLIVQLRTTGKAATGELAIGRIGDRVYVGRWWQKHGQKALMTDGLSEVTVGPSKRSLKVVAVINQIVRAK